MSAPRTTSERIAAAFRAGTPVDRAIVRAVKQATARQMTVSDLLRDGRAIDAAAARAIRKAVSESRKAARSTRGKRAT